MKIFEDVQGRTWSIDLNIEEARPFAEWLKKETEIDLFRPADTLAAFGSIFTALDALSFLCREQRRKRKEMSDADFGRAFKGKVAYDAQRALLEEYCDFFPDPRIQALIEKSLTSILSASDAQSAILEKRILQTVEAIQTATEIMNRRITGTPSPGSPGSEESEPVTGASRGANSPKPPKPRIKGVGKSRR